MLDLLRATRRCFVYAPVRLRRRELLSMAWAVGFELQADSEALWITVDSESRDIFLAPGEQFRIRTEGRVLISADSAVTIVVSGEADRGTSFAVIRANGEREDVYPPAALSCGVAPILAADPSAAGRRSFELRQAAGRRARRSELDEFLLGGTQ
jgi:hypothetical protein